MLRARMLQEQPEAQGHQFSCVPERYEAPTEMGATNKQSRTARQVRQVFLFNVFEIFLYLMHDMLLR